MSSDSVVVIPPVGFRRELKFSGDFKEAIFGKEIMKMSIPKSWDSSSVKENHERYNEYTLNNYNYRGPDFTSGVDIITAGCSQTFGIGVPDNGPWPVHLAETLKASYVNTAMPGASVGWIIDSIYKYIDTFGPPKRGIVALFPDILRYDVVLNNSLNRTLETSDSDFVPQYYSDDEELRVMSYSPRGYPAPSLIKRPYPIEHTLLMEHSVRAAILKIRDLERFCKHAGIKLVWSSWANSLVWLIRDLPEEYSFDNYVPLYGLADWKSHIHPIEKTELDPEGIFDYKLDHNGNYKVTGCTKAMQMDGTCICFSRCHFERLDEFPMSFHEGSDRYRDGGSHYGVHKHIHIAADLAAKAIEIGM